MKKESDTKSVLDSHSDTPSSSSGHILVVDDERNIRSTLEMVLSNAGYRVKTAADGTEAETILAKSEFDVILLDVRLPGRTGVQLLTHWKAQWPNTFIILMSGEATISEALEGVRQGAFDFLEKPILSARLLSSLSHAMERQRTKSRIDLGNGESVVGQSPQINKLLDDAHKVAPTKARILVTGESGTGKDVLARYIHLNSARRDRPFIKINCASISQDLIESELFGHCKGAFTGAISARRGYFECANGGTLFLDEVGELPLAAQAKLLRTLQNGEVTPVGTSETFIVDVRVISATNRDLKSEVTRGRFREDLYYRLAVVVMESPPLRDRHADISAIANHFNHVIATDYGVAPKQLDSAVLSAFESYSWPGNIRELRNVLERCMILSGSTIGLADLPPEIASCSQMGSHSHASAHHSSASGALEPWHIFKSRSEREHILRALELAAGNMADAAKLLHVERQTIYKWMKSYGIERQ